MLAGRRRYGSLAVCALIGKVDGLPASKLLLRAELLLQLLAALRLRGGDQVLVIVVRDERPRCVRRNGSGRRSLIAGSWGQQRSHVALGREDVRSSPREAIRAAGNETIPERVARRPVAASCLHAFAEQLMLTAGCCLWCLVWEKGRQVWRPWTSIWLTPNAAMAAEGDREFVAGDRE